MKKIYILTAVFALLTLSLNAKSLKPVDNQAAPTETSSMKAPNRATHSVTVGDQSSDTQYLPVYGWWYDGYQINQMIYTATQLQIPTGSKIKSITFYPYNGLQLNGGTITFSLGTTTASSLSALISSSDISNLTQVKTITPSANSSLTEWTITFDTDFTYNGNNLLVQINTTSGSDDRSYFYGQRQNNTVCYYTYGYSNPPGNNGSSNILPKATFTYEDAGPTVNVSPESRTINDSGTNNTFEVESRNIPEGHNLGVNHTNNDFSLTLTSATNTIPTTWVGFEQNNGSVDGNIAVTYNGRALTATDEITAATEGANKTVTVTYVPDLYIYCDNGASPWDFSANPAVAMTNNGDGTYTATLEDIPANSHILFGRASGLTYGWEGDGNRLFIGASTDDGSDWAYGNNTWGYLDTDPYNDNPVKYHPIYFSEGGTYIVTIDANAYTFSIIGKTATPTISVESNADGSKTVTATGNGTVHLYVDGEEVSNPYIILASTDGDKTYTVTATAQEEGKLISETATETVTVAEAGRTPTPAIDVEEHNGYVVITATGDGTVTLSAGGQTATSETGTATITIVKSTEEQTVTATATAQDGDLAQSYPATRSVTIPALTTDPTTALEGLLRLHLLMVDQMFEDIPDDNSHPDRYNYVLRYEPNGPSGDGVKESSTVHVDIQKADCEVTGYYSLKQIDNDKNIGLDHKQGITMDVVTADVAYNLSNNNDKLYEYILQGATDRIPEYQKDYLTKLRKSQNFTYFEMWEKSPNKGTEYPNGEHHYLDSLMIGTYGSSFRSYAPSVSTDGIERRYYEDDGYDNTYGAPIWKTAVGEVKMSEDEAPKAERQTNAWNSVNWMDKDANGNDAPASLYILDNIWATAKLPHTQIATVQYEPYMFRIFVESKNGLLRPYEIVPEGSGETDGEHLAPVDRELTEADVKGPLCVWSGYLQFDEDGEVIGDQPNGVKVQVGTAEGGQKTYTYNKMKVDRPGGSSNNGVGNQDWDQDANNAMFGALDALAISGYDSNGKPIMNTDITSDDLNIFVRFYYVVKGMADGWEPGSRGQGDDPAGYGTESPGTSPEPATGVNEIQFLGEIVSQTYYNVQGMQSDQPFDGINIVVTRYSNGATSVTKVIK